MLKEFPIRELQEAVGTETVLLTLLLVDMSKINSRNVVNYRLKVLWRETTLIIYKNTAHITDAEVAEATRSLHDVRYFCGSLL
jgi:hypothetical protein